MSAPAPAFPEDPADVLTRKLKALDTKLEFKAAQLEEEIEETTEVVNGLKARTSASREHDVRIFKNKKVDAEPGEDENEGDEDESIGEGHGLPGKRAVEQR